MRKIYYVSTIIKSKLMKIYFGEKIYGFTSGMYTVLIIITIIYNNIIIKVNLIVKLLE